MWEFAILINSDKKEIAKNLYSRIRCAGDEYENIVSFHEKDSIITITTGCGNLESYRYKTFIEDLIIDVFCDSYKKFFLLSHLSINAYDEIANEAFIQALLYFDRETDRYIVSKYLNIENQINLDGFFNFKLKTLREKWDELVGIANENQVYLYSNDTFIELIKFLVDNIEFKSDVINIVEQDKKYIITNSDFEEICFEKKSENVEKDLISSLITLCPKNINIYCSDIMPGNVTNLICSLFEKRVRFLTKVN